jgi:hypothetical protein
MKARNKYYTNISRWLLTALFLLISVLNFIRIDSGSHSASDTLRPFIIQTAALLLIFYLVHILITRKLITK